MQFSSRFQSSINQFLKKQFQNNQIKIPSITKAVENKNALHYIIIGRVHDTVSKKKKYKFKDLIIGSITILEKQTAIYVLWLVVSDQKLNEKWGYHLPNPDIANYPTFQQYGLGCTFITLVQRMQKFIHGEINIVLQTNRDTTMAYYSKLHFEEVDDDGDFEIKQFIKDLGDHYIEDKENLVFMQSIVPANQYSHHLFQDYVGSDFLQKIHETINILFSLNLDENFVNDNESVVNMIHDVLKIDLQNEPTHKWVTLLENDELDDVNYKEKHLASEAIYQSIFNIDNYNEDKEFILVKYPNINNDDFFKQLSSLFLGQAKKANDLKMALCYMYRAISILSNDNNLLKNMKPKIVEIIARTIWPNSKNHKPNINLLKEYMKCISNDLLSYDGSKYDSSKLNFVFLSYLLKVKIFIVESTAVSKKDPYLNQRAWLNQLKKITPIQGILNQENIPIVVLLKTEKNKYEILSIKDRLVKKDDAYLHYLARAKYYDINHLHIINEKFEEWISLKRG